MWGTLQLMIGVAKNGAADGGHPAALAGAEVHVAMRGRRRGALEQEVLASLAAANRPLTVAEVLVDLGDELAYTTVMTTLSRLYEKGVLDRRPSGRAFAYSLRSDPASLAASVTARRMSRLLHSGTDHAGVLARFVADLAPEEGRLLAELLAQPRPDDGEPPRQEPDEPTGTAG